MRVHLEYAHSLDPGAWERAHAEGLVPDRLPYGLDRMAVDGIELDVQPPPRSVVGRVASAVTRKAFDRLAVGDALRDRSRRRADVAVCWDERTGVPAALRSVVPGEPPAVIGVLWMTEPDNGLGAVPRRMARAGARRAAAVWANTEEQLGVLEGWGVPRSRMHLVQLGVDADFWAPGDAEPVPGLVVGGGNDRHRDHPLLVEAMTRVQAARPEARLELASYHDVDVPPALGRRHTHLSHPDLRALYRRASVVAVTLRPNLHISGSTVMLEAMACARPVVISRTPGVDQYVRDGETGILVPPGDAAAVTDAIASLLADPAAAAEIGRAGRRLVEERFTSGDQARSLVRILESLRA